MLMYADDKVLDTSNAPDLQRLINKMAEIFVTKELKVNLTKTKMMIFRKQVQYQAHAVQFSRANAVQFVRALAMQFEHSQAIQFIWVHAMQYSHLGSTSRSRPSKATTRAV